jgi:hypothetical protein
MCSPRRRQWLSAVRRARGEAHWRPFYRWAHAWGEQWVSRCVWRRIKGRRAITDACGRRRRGTQRGVRPAGRQRGHGVLVGGQRGIRSRVARDSIMSLGHGVERPGARTSRSGGGMLGAAWPTRRRALWRPWAQSHFNCPVSKFQIFQKLNCTQTPMNRTIVEWSILYTIYPNRAPN